MNLTQLNKDFRIFRFLLIPGLMAFCLLQVTTAFSQDISPHNNNLIWTSQSKNSGESMPCGGGDIGLNVWTEKNEIFAYVARSGTFDENNSLLKLGRVRLSLSPNPFDGGTFKQELVLKDGYVLISGTKGNLTARIKIWVDVFQPVIHFDIQSSQKITTTASYETWRNTDRVLTGKENNQNSYKWAPQGIVHTSKDQISFTSADEIEFYHQNKPATVFDVTLKQQGLDLTQTEWYNPLKDLIFGGKMSGKHMANNGTAEGSYLNLPFKAWKIKTKSPVKQASIQLALLTKQGTLNSWREELAKISVSDDKRIENKNEQWWHTYWDRSFIVIQSPQKEANQAGRNYQLFRYMLGCNAFGKWPTKFNGGLFTFDPQLTDSNLTYTPDFRNWGGGTHTAQNQRLVYWPMLKSGDFDLMLPQFDFYLRLLPTAEKRSEQYWHHKGASFTEQLENFGLPNPAEYGWKRPAGYDPGMEYNAWLEYEWDTVLEFCQMILETEKYDGRNIRTYLPLIESCLTFFEEHYTFLAKKRGSKALDANGHLILYPGSAAETYKMTYNSTSTIAALKTVLKTLAASGSINELQRQKWLEMLRTIPPINYREFNGHTTISPAKVWERINNTESPQLYPVFPWGIFGVGKPGLDTAINTFKFDTDVLKFRSHIGWKQDNIFAARLGLTAEAAELTVAKLKDSERRFPAFWGPGYDWTPDHNWGGSGMIGLQEMLIQINDDQILLFPAWPKDWNVHFKLHAPGQTTVECVYKNGKIERLNVVPKSRRKDVVICNQL